jgi:serine/threonine-protein kinase
MLVLLSATIARADEYHPPVRIGIVEHGVSYTITVGKRLGAGKLGVVHEATDEKTGEKRVIKILTDHGVATREAEALSRTRGRSRLLQAFGTGDVDGRKVLVLSHAGGAPLGGATSLPKHPVDHAVRLTLELLRDLRELHAAGLVHGDVAPQNILVDGEAVHLIDYGNAVAPGHSTPGTWEFMPPEQFHGRPVDERSDVYEAAGVLVASITGRSPFRIDYGRYYESLRDAHEAGRADFADHEIPNAALRDVIHRALDPDPARRYPTAQSLIDALRPFQRP